MELDLLKEISDLKARVGHLESVLNNMPFHGNIDAYSRVSVQEPPKPPATRVVRDDRKPLVLQAGLASFLSRK